MLNPESRRDMGHAPRAVGSPAPDTVDKGHIIKACANRSCPNKGANWALQEKLT